AALRGRTRRRQGPRSRGAAAVSAALRGVAVVTGASGGIGRAVTRALASPELSLCLAGRDEARLRAAAEEAAAHAARVMVHAADLATDEGLCGLVERVSRELGSLDVLVHAAGALCLGDVEAAGWDDLDMLYRVNLRAPFLLTKAFLPLLKESRGQGGFVDSSARLA